MTLERNCPDCGKILIYSNRKALRRSIRGNTKCLRCAQKGKVFSDETRQKMRDSRRDMSGAKNPNYGKVSANRGKKVEDFMSAENAAKLRNAAKRGLFKGGTHSVETRKKIGMPGDRNPFFGKKHTEETKSGIRKRTISMIQAGVLTKSTKPELIFETYLIELGVVFEKQKQIAFWLFDFYLPDYDIYIECDGDYWHANPEFFKPPLTFSQQKNLVNDKRKNSMIAKAGKTLLRFWEHEIINNKAMVFDRINEKIQCAS